MKIIAVLIPVLLICYSCSRKPRPGGLLLPIRDSINKIPLAASAGERALQFGPADMQNSLPPAGDQGQQGSCVSWTLDYYLASYYEKYLGGRNGYNVINGRPDPKLVYSPSFVYNYLKQNSVPEECLTGILFSDAFNVLQYQGVCSWSDLPYDANSESCKAPIQDSVFKKAGLQKGYKFQRLDLTLDNIKYYVFAGYPIIIGLFITKDFYDFGLNQPAGKRFTWKPSSGDKAAYHAMLIAGYDGNNLKLLNSYGSDWGNDGYVWISYGDLYKRTVESYISVKTKPALAIQSLNSFNELTAALINATPDGYAFQKNAARYNAITYHKFDFTNARGPFGHLKIPIPMTANQKEGIIREYRMDRVKKEMFLSLSDSASEYNPYNYFSDKGEKKQFYTGDTLVTLTADTQLRDKRYVTIRLKLDSGVVDKNIKHIDSSLNATYLELANENDDDESKADLKNEFERWRKGYPKDYLTVQKSKIRWNSVIISVIVVLISLFIFYLGRRTKRL